MMILTRLSKISMTLRWNMLTWLHFWEHSAISLYLNAIGFADDLVSGYFLKIIFLDTKAMKFSIFGDVGCGKISIAAYQIFY